MFKPRRHLSQNFLHNRQLVAELVGRTSIGKRDTVIEIGPGEGIITRELAKAANQVIAVEIDSSLTAEFIYKCMYGQLPNNVVWFESNALDFPLPQTNYKVFSNLPFSIEGKMVRRLLQAKNPPQAAWLVVRKKPARRWAGISYRSLFSIRYGPWFEFKIIYQFKADDFKPRTHLSPVLLAFCRRQPSLLAARHKPDFQQFVEQGFARGPNVYQNLRKYLSVDHLKQIQHKLKQDLNCKPTDLSLSNWIKLFRLESASKNKR